MLTSDLLKLATGEFSDEIYLLLFDEIFSYIPQLSTLQANIFGFGVRHFTIITLLIFVAVEKFNQFPLHVWLPDAEGPTTISTLILAVTMITAGVLTWSQEPPICLPCPPSSWNTIVIPFLWF